MLQSIFLGLDYFLQLLRYVVLIYLVLTWFVSPYNKLMKVLYRVVDPLLRPIRNILFRFLPRMMIDPSPIVLFLLMDVVRRFVWQIYYWIR